MPSSASSASLPAGIVDFTVKAMLRTRMDAELRDPAPAEFYCWVMEEMNQPDLKPTPTRHDLINKAMMNMQQNTLKIRKSRLQAIHH